MLPYYRYYQCYLWEHLWCSVFLERSHVIRQFTSSTLPLHAHGNIGSRFDKPDEMGRDPGNFRAKPSFYIAHHPWRTSRRKTNKSATQIMIQIWSSPKLGHTHFFHGRSPLVCDEWREVEPRTPKWEEAEDKEHFCSSSINSQAEPCRYKYVLQARVDNYGVVDE